MAPKTQKSIFLRLGCVKIASKTQKSIFLHFWGVKKVPKTQKSFFYVLGVSTNYANLLVRVLLG